RRKVVLENLLSFDISSALSSLFQRTVFSATVRYNFKNLVVWRNFQRRFFEKAPVNGKKDSLLRLNC
ncbi:MAG: hypothetical protein J6C86_05955, partial [Bacteroidaceae bacterium]|nr:hypothetical protein [Bacteroidaceae bacterium]